jgi:hypothetical protein
MGEKLNSKQAVKILSGILFNKSMSRFSVENAAEVPVTQVLEDVVQLGASYELGTAQWVHSKRILSSGILWGSHCNFKSQFSHLKSDNELGVQLRGGACAGSRFNP